MSSDEVDRSADAVFNGQLYLFEAIGSISSARGPRRTSRRYTPRSGPGTPVFRHGAAPAATAASGDAQAILQVHHIVMALGTLANGFSDWHPGSVGRRQGPPPVQGCLR